MKLDEMIEEATFNETIARGLQDQADIAKESLELVLRAGSSTRECRELPDPSDLETQIEQLKEEAARQWELVQSLWNKIREMQEQEKNN